MANLNVQEIQISERFLAELNSTLVSILERVPRPDCALAESRAEVSASRRSARVFGEREVAAHVPEEYPNWSRQVTDSADRCESGCAKFAYFSTLAKSYCCMY
jgi:hypothetical protein